MFLLRCSLILVPMGFLFAGFCPTANGDITISNLYRHAHHWHYESDTITGTNEHFFGPYTSLVQGDFSHSHSEADHPGIGLASLNSSFSHSSMLIASATALSLAGVFQSQVTASATTTGFHVGGAQWSIRTQVDLIFTVNAPTYFQLQGQTVLGNTSSSSYAAFVALGSLGTFSSPGPSSPDIAAYGQSWGSAGSNGWGYSSPFASGSIQGTLMPGSYEFHAIVVESSGVSPGQSYSDNKQASFNFSLSTVPEPGTCFLGAVGLIGLASQTRRRRVR